MNKQNYIINQNFKLIRLQFGIIFGIILGILGGMANMGVMANNGGLMPVFITEPMSLAPTDTHFFYSHFSEVNYWWFTDWIPLFNSIWSPGDFLIIFGIIYTIVHAIFFIYTIIITRRTLNEINKRTHK